MHPNITRAAEEEAREIEVQHAIGREMEDAVDLMSKQLLKIFPSLKRATKSCTTNLEEST